MINQSLVKWVGVQLAASLIGLMAAVAQTAAPQPAAPYEPSVGQKGKDVVWVPTPDGTVAKMLELTQVTPSDFVIDLGSGDGRTVIAAALRGAKTFGIEYEQPMVDLSIANAAKAGVSDRATFRQGDLFQSDFSQATVLTMFLLPDINLRLRPIILDMKPGTRVASNTFTMGDWEPDQKAEANDCKSAYCTALFWIVPAKVAGTWRSENGTLTLEQKYQMVSGTMQSGGTSREITAGRLKGEEITFTVGETIFTGRVSGNTIEGKAGSNAWRATRN